MAPKASEVVRNESRALMRYYKEKEFHERLTARLCGDLSCHLDTTDGDICADQLVAPSLISLFTSIEFCEGSRDLSDAVGMGDVYCSEDGPALRAPLTAAHKVLLTTESDVFCVADMTS